jgi:alkylation response protein AidB-like acyl-CoA dehydrogenase
MGVFGLRRPEADGGAGLGMAEAVLVFEELGRALVPGPLIGTVLAAGLAAGSGQAGAVAGAVAGLLDRAEPPVLIEHPERLDVLYVLAGDGVRRLDPARLDARPVERPVDPLTPLALVPELPPGELVAGPAEAERWRREGTVLAAALQLGIASRTVEKAVAYAGRREQFGRPIGAFQAVKHLVADMLVRAEVARPAVYAAAVTLDDPASGDAAVAVAAAKLLADEAATANARAAVQVHGGMGFTWEADVHLYLKRSWVLAGCFGGADEHAEALAARL